MESTYKKKYLKYKFKYLNLLKIQHGGNCEQNIKTIPNDGTYEGMINQCFWISIVDYLNMNGYPDITVRILKDQASDRGNYPINNDIEMFDTDFFGISAEKIAEIYNLKIVMYGYNFALSCLEITPIPLNTIGNGINLVPIASYGAHFELIVKSTLNDLTPKIKSTKSSNEIHDFTPDINLAIGKYISEDEEKREYATEIINSKQKVNKNYQKIAELINDNEKLNAKVDTANKTNIFETNEAKKKILGIAFYS